MNTVPISNIENEQNRAPQQIDWKQQYDWLNQEMEELKQQFKLMMDEQKETLTREINDLKKENQELKQKLNYLRGKDGSDSSG